MTCKADARIRRWAHSFGKKDFDPTATAVTSPARSSRRSRLTWVLRRRLPSLAAHRAVTSRHTPDFPNQENPRQEPARPGLEAAARTGRGRASAVTPCVVTREPGSGAEWLADPGSQSPPDLRHRGSSHPPPDPPLRPQAALAVHGARTSRCSRPDVIAGRRDEVAGTRSQEDVSDAATLQFTRSADAIYGELRAGGRGPGPTLCVAFLSLKLLEFCTGVKRGQRRCAAATGSRPRCGLGRR